MSKNTGGGMREGFYSSFLGIVKDMSEKQVSDLKDRLSKVEEFNPISSIKNTLDAVKDMGLGQTTNIEIAKMQTDSEKWKYEMAKREETGNARAQLQDFGESLRTGIEKLARPSPRVSQMASVMGVRQRRLEPSVAQDSQGGRYP
ncbi:MAG: hypothetical protein ACRECH_07245 [Nitrososphaerales archaeon]